MTQMRTDHSVPAGTALVGMWLGLASLAMLFLSSMVGYIIIRLTGTTMPALASVSLPWLLWLSTVVVLAGSMTIHLALGAIRLERQAETRKWIWLTLALAVLFCLVQIPGLWQLVDAHFAAKDLESRNHLYGLIFVLILLHALHVLGGVVNLAVVAVKTTRGAYDHENYTGIRLSAMYWHFLDIVWIVMFGTMLALG